MSRIEVEHVPPLDQNDLSSQGGVSGLTGLAILAVVILAAALFGNFTRPVGHLSAFWPANALLVGMLLRNPRLASPLGILAAAASYICADLIGGGALEVTLFLTGANMFGALVVYCFFARLEPVDRRMGRPRSVLYFVLGATLAAASAGLVGGAITPAYFAGTMLDGWKFWFVGEAVNYIAMLPVVLTLPSYGRIIDWRTWTRTPLSIQQVAPAVVLLLSAISAIAIGGPGAIGFPVPALLWCALVYSQFATALLTLLFTAGTLVAISTGLVPMSFDNSDWSALMSIRIGVTLIALAPITVASVTAARNELLHRLKYLATHDQLTGLLNRGAFRDVASEKLRKLAAEAKPVAMLMLDVDRFKRINDTHGHAVGDRVLTAFSKIVAGNLREFDLVGRVGGEEFAVLLPDCSTEQAEAIANRIRTAYEDAAIDIDGGDVIKATVSIGAVALGKAITELDALLAAADRSLYRAKREGRNRVERGGLDGKWAALEEPDASSSPTVRT